MLLLIQIAGVAITGAFALMFLLLVIGPALGGILHGRRFHIVPWHALVAGIAVTLCVWQASIYGFVGGAS